MQHCNCTKQKLLSESLVLAGSRLTASWVTTTTSTNDDVKELVKNTEDCLWTVRVADVQRAGRGTRGRSWSAPEASLLLTLGIPLATSTENPAGLSLIVGAACVDVLKEFNPEVRLKWPNDIWINGGKAAGILCEIVHSRSRFPHAVVGIGVNICLGQTSVPTTDVPAAALFVQSLKADELQAIRLRLAVSLALAIESICSCLNCGALAEVRSKWPQLDAFADRTVLLTLPSGEMKRGRVAGIGAVGELLFIDEGGRMSAFSDARIRPLQND